MWPRKLLDSQIAGVLTSVLGQYVILDQDQLQLSYWSGTAELKNLAIRPDIFQTINNKNNNNNSKQSLMNQLSLNLGTIDVCRVTVPWASLDSEPLVAEIEGIDLRLTLDLSTVKARDEEKGENDDRDSDPMAIALDAFEQLKKDSLQLFMMKNIDNTTNGNQNESAPTNSGGAGFLDGLVSVIKQNVRLSAKRISIQLKIVKNNEVACIAEVTLGEALSVATDSSWQPRFIVPPSNQQQNISSNANSSNNTNQENLFQFRSLSLDNLSLKIKEDNNSSSNNSNNSRDGAESVIFSLPNATGSLFLRQSYSSSTASQDFSFRFFPIGGIFVDVQKIQQLSEKLLGMSKSSSGSLEKQKSITNEKHRHEYILSQELRLRLSKKMRNGNNNKIWNSLREYLSISTKKDLSWNSRIKPFCIMRNTIMEILNKKYLAKVSTNGDESETPSWQHLFAQQPTNLFSEEDYKFMITLSFAQIKLRAIKENPMAVNVTEENKNDASSLPLANVTNSSPLGQQQDQQKAGWFSWMWGANNNNNNNVAANSTANQQQTASAPSNDSNKLGEYLSKLSLVDLILLEENSSPVSSSSSSSSSPTMSLDIRGIRHAIVKLSPSFFLRVNSSSISLLQGSNAVTENNNKTRLSFACEDQFVISLLRHNPNSNNNNQQQDLLIAEIEISNKVPAQSAGENEVSETVTAASNNPTKVLVQGPTTQVNSSVTMMMMMDEKEIEEMKKENMPKKLINQPAIHASIFENGNENQKHVEIGTVIVQITLDEHLVEFAKEFTSQSQQQNKNSIATTAASTSPSSQKSITSAVEASLYHISFVSKMPLVASVGNDSPSSVSIIETSLKALKYSALNVSATSTNNNTNTTSKTVTSFQEPECYFWIEEHVENERAVEFVASFKCDARTEISTSQGENSSRSVVTTLSPSLGVGDIQTVTDVRSFEEFSKILKLLKKEIMEKMITKEEQQSKSDTVDKKKQQQPLVVGTSEFVLRITSRNILNTHLVFDVQIRHSVCGVVHFQSRLSASTAEAENNYSRNNSNVWILHQESSCNNKILQARPSSSSSSISILVSLLRLTLQDHKIPVLETTNITITRSFSADQQRQQETKVIFANSLHVSMIATLAPLIQSIVTATSAPEKSNDTSDKQLVSASCETVESKNNGSVLVVECRKEIVLDLLWSNRVVIMKTTIFGKLPLRLIKRASSTQIDIADLRVDVLNPRCGDATSCLIVGGGAISSTTKSRREKMITPNHHHPHSFAPLLHSVDVFDVNQNDSALAIAQHLMKTKPSNLTSHKIEEHSSHLHDFTNDAPLISLSMSSTTSVTECVINGIRNSSSSNGKRILLVEQWHDAFMTLSGSFTDPKNPDSPLQMLLSATPRKNNINSTAASTTRNNNNHHHQPSPVFNLNYSGLFCRIPFWGDIPSSILQDSKIYNKIEAPIIFAESISTQSSTASHNSKGLSASLTKMEKLGFLLSSSQLNNNNNDDSNPLVYFDTSDIHISVQPIDDTHENQDDRDDQTHEYKNALKNIAMSLVPRNDNNNHHNNDSSSPVKINFSNPNISIDLMPLLISNLANLFWSSSKEKGSMTYVMENYKHAQLNQLLFGGEKQKQQDEEQDHHLPQNNIVAEELDCWMSFTFTSSNKTPFSITIPVVQDSTSQQQQQQQNNSCWSIQIPSIEYKRNFYKSTSGSQTQCLFPDGLSLIVAWNGVGAARLELGSGSVLKQLSEVTTEDYDDRNGLENILTTAESTAILETADDSTLQLNLASLAALGRVPPPPALDVEATSILSNMSVSSCCPSTAALSPLLALRSSFQLRWNGRIFGQTTINPENTDNTYFVDCQAHRQQTEQQQPQQGMHNNPTNHNSLIFFGMSESCTLQRDNENNFELREVPNPLLVDDEDNINNNNNNNTGNDENMKTTARTLVVRHREVKLNPTPGCTITAGKLSRVIAGGVLSPTIFASLSNGARFKVVMSKKTVSDAREDLQQETPFHVEEQIVQLGDACVHSVTQTLKFAAWATQQQSGDEKPETKQQLNENNNNNNDNNSDNIISPFSFSMNNFIVDDVDTSRLIAINKIRFSRENENRFGFFIQEAIGLIQVGAQLEVSGEIRNNNNRVIHVSSSSNSEQISNNAIIKPGLCVSSTLIDRVFALKERFQAAIDEFLAVLHRKPSSATSQHNNHNNNNGKEDDGVKSISQTQVELDAITINLIDMGGVLASVSLIGGRFDSSEEKSDFSLVQISQKENTNHSNKNHSSAITILLFEGREQHNNLKTIASVTCRDRDLVATDATADASSRSKIVHFSSVQNKKNDEINHHAQQFLDASNASISTMILQQNGLVAWITRAKQFANAVSASIPKEEKQISKNKEQAVTDENKNNALNNNNSFTGGNKANHHRRSLSASSPTAIPVSASDRHDVTSSNNTSSPPPRTHHKRHVSFGAEAERKSSEERNGSNGVVASLSSSSSLSPSPTKNSSSTSSPPQVSASFGNFSITIDGLAGVEISDTHISATANMFTTSMKLSSSSSSSRGQTKTSYVSPKIVFFSHQHHYSHVGDHRDREDSDVLRTDLMEFSWRSIELRKNIILPDFLMNIIAAPTTSSFVDPTSFSSSFPSSTLENLDSSSFPRHEQYISLVRPHFKILASPRSLIVTVERTYQKVMLGIVRPAKIAGIAFVDKENEEVTTIGHESDDDSSDDYEEGKQEKEDSLTTTRRGSKRLLRLRASLLVKPPQNVHTSISVSEFQFSHESTTHLHQCAHHDTTMEKKIKVAFIVEHVKGEFTSTPTIRFDMVDVAVEGLHLKLTSSLTTTTVSSQIKDQEERQEKMIEKNQQIHDRNIIRKFSCRFHRSYGHHMLQISTSEIYAILPPLQYFHQNLLFSHQPLPHHHHIHNIHNTSGNFNNNINNNELTSVVTFTEFVRFLRIAITGQESNLSINNNSNPQEFRKSSATSSSSRTSLLRHLLASRQNRALLAQAQNRQTALQSQQQLQLHHSARNEPSAVRSAAANQLANFSVSIPCFIVVLSPFSTVTTSAVSSSSSSSATIKTPKNSSIDAKTVSTTTTTITSQANTATSGLGAASLDLSDIRASSQLLGSTRILELRIQTVRPVANLGGISSSSSVIGSASSSNLLSGASSTSSSSASVISFCITKEPELVFASSAGTAPSGSNPSVNVNNNSNSTTSPTGSPTGSTSTPAVSLTCKMKNPYHQKLLSASRYFMKQGRADDDNEVDEDNHNQEEDDDDERNNNNSNTTASAGSAKTVSNRLSDRIPDREVSISASIGGRVDFSFDANHLENLLEGFVSSSSSSSTAVGAATNTTKSVSTKNKNKNEDNSSSSSSSSDSDAVEENKIQQNNHRHDPIAELEEEDALYQQFYHDITNDMELWVDETIGSQGTKSWRFRNNNINANNSAKTAAIAVQGRNRSTSGPQIFPTIFVDIHNVEHFLPIKVDDGLSVFFSNVNFVIMLDPSELLHLARCRNSGQIPPAQTVLLEYCIHFEGPHSFLNLNPTNCRVDYQMKQIPGMTSYYYHHHHQNVNSIVGLNSNIVMKNDKQQRQHVRESSGASSSAGAGVEGSSSHNRSGSSVDQLVSSSSHNDNNNINININDDDDDSNDDLLDDEERQRRIQIKIQRQKHLQQQIDPHFLLSARNLRKQQELQQHAKVKKLSSSAHTTKNNSKNRNIHNSGVATKPPSPSSAEQPNHHHVLFDQQSATVYDGLKSTVFKLHVSVPYGVSFKIGLPAPRKTASDSSSSPSTRINDLHDDRERNNNNSAPSSLSLHENTWWVVIAASNAEVNTDTVQLTAIPESPAHSLLFFSALDDPSTSKQHSSSSQHQSSSTAFNNSAGSSQPRTSSSSSGNSTTSTTNNNNFFFYSAPSSSWNTIARGISRCCKALPVQVDLTRSSVFDFAGVNIAIAADNSSGTQINLAPLFLSPTSVMVQASSSEQPVSVQTSASSSSSPAFVSTALSETAAETWQVVLEPIQIVISPHLVASLVARVNALQSRLTQSTKKLDLNNNSRQPKNHHRGEKIDDESSSSSSQTLPAVQGKTLIVAPRKNFLVNLPLFSLEVCPFVNLVPLQQNNNNFTRGDSTSDFTSSSTNNNNAYSFVDVIRGTISIEAKRPCVSLVAFQIENFSFHASYPTDKKKLAIIEKAFCESFLLYGPRFSFVSQTQQVAYSSSAASNNNNNNNGSNVNPSAEVLLIHNVELTRETSTLSSVKDIVSFFPVSVPLSKDHTFTVGAIMFDLHNLVQSTGKISQQFSHLMELASNNDDNNNNPFCSLTLEELGGLEFRNETGLDVVLKMATILRNDPGDENQDENDKLNTKQDGKSSCSLFISSPSILIKGNNKKSNIVVVTPPPCVLNNNNNIINASATAESSAKRHEKSSSSATQMQPFMLWSLFAASQKRASISPDQQQKVEVFFFAKNDNNKAMIDASLLSTCSYPVELYYPEKTSEPFLIRLDVDWLNRSIRLVSTFKINIALNDDENKSFDYALLLGSNYQEIYQNQISQKEKETNISSLDDLITLFSASSGEIGNTNDDDDDNEDEEKREQINNSNKGIVLAKSSTTSTSSSIDIPYSPSVYFKPITLVVHSKKTNTFFMSASSGNSSSSLLPGARSLDSLRFILDQRRLMRIEQQFHTSSRSSLVAAGSKVQETFILPMTSFLTTKMNNNNNNNNIDSQRRPQILPLVLHSGGTGRNNDANADFVTELTIAPLVSVVIDPVLEDLGLTASICSFGKHFFASSSSNSTLLFDENESQDPSAASTMTIQLSIDSIKQSITHKMSIPSSSSALSSSLALNIAGAHLIVDLVKMNNNKHVIANQSRLVSNSTDLQSLYLENGSLWKCFVRPQRIVSCLGVDNNLLQLSSVHSKHSLLSNPGGKVFDQQHRAALSLQGACRSTSLINDDFDATETVLWCRNVGSSTTASSPSSSSSTSLFFSKDTKNLEIVGGKRWTCIENWPAIRALEVLKFQQQQQHEQQQNVESSSESQQTTSPSPLNSASTSQIREEGNSNNCNNNNRPRTSSISCNFDSCNIIKYFGSIEHGVIAVTSSDHSSDNVSLQQENNESLTIRPAIVVKTVGPGPQLEARWGNTAEVVHSSANNKSNDNNAAGAENLTIIAKKKFLPIFPDVWTIPNFDGSDEALEDTNFQISVDIRLVGTSSNNKNNHQSTVAGASSAPSSSFCRISLENLVSMVTNTSSSVPKTKIFCFTNQNNIINNMCWIEVSASLRRGTLAVLVRHLTHSPILPVNTLPYEMRIRRANPAYQENKMTEEQLANESLLASEYVIVQPKTKLSSSSLDVVKNLFQPCYSLTKKSQHLRIEFWSPKIPVAISSSNQENSKNSASTANRAGWGSWLKSWVVSAPNTDSTQNSTPVYQKQHLLAVAVIEPFDAAASSRISEQRALANIVVSVGNNNSNTKVPSISVIAIRDHENSNSIRLTSCFTEHVGLIGSVNTNNNNNKIVSSYENDVDTLRHMIHFNNNVNDTSVYLFQAKIEKLLATFDSSFNNSNNSNPLVKITTLCEHASLNAHATFRKLSQTAEIALRGSAKNIDVAQQVFANGVSEPTITAPLTVCPLASSTAAKTKDEQAKTAAAADCFTFQSDGFLYKNHQMKNWNWSGRQTRVALGKIIIDVNDHTALALVPLLQHNSSASASSSSSNSLFPFQKRIYKNNILPSSSSQQSHNSNNSNSKHDIGKFTLESISLDVTLRQLGNVVQMLSSSSSSSSSSTTKLLKAIGDIEHAIINISKFVSYQQPQREAPLNTSDAIVVHGSNNSSNSTNQSDRQSNNMNDLAKQLTSHVTGEILFQLPLILGSLATLGNPTGLVRDVLRSVVTLANEAVLQGRILPGAFHFVRDVAGAALHSAASVSRSGGKLLLFATGSSGGSNYVNNKSSIDDDNNDAEEDANSNNKNNNQQEKTEPVSITVRRLCRLLSAKRSQNGKSEIDENNQTFFFTQSQSQVFLHRSSSSAENPELAHMMFMSSSSSSSSVFGSNAGRGTMSVVAGAVTRPVALLLQGVGNVTDYVGSFVETNPEISITTSKAVKAKLQAANEERTKKRSSVGTNNFSSSSLNFLTVASNNSSNCESSSVASSSQQPTQQQQNEKLPTASGAVVPPVTSQQQVNPHPQLTPSESSLRRIAPSEDSYSLQAGSSIKSLHLLSNSSAKAAELQQHQNGIDNKHHGASSPAGSSASLVMFGGANIVKNAIDVGAQTASDDKKRNNVFAVQSPPRLRRQIIQGIVQHSIENVLKNNSNDDEDNLRFEKTVQLIQNLFLVVNSDKSTSESNNNNNGNPSSLLTSIFTEITTNIQKQIVALEKNNNNNNNNNNSAVTVSSILLSCSETIRNMILLWISSTSPLELIFSSPANNNNHNNNNQLVAIESNLLRYVQEKYRQQIVVETIFCAESRRQRALALRNSLLRNNNEKLVADHVSDEAAMVMISQSWKEALIASNSGNNNVPLAYQEWILNIGFLQSLSQ